MSFVDADIKTGIIPPRAASRAEKKRYAELLADYLAVEIAQGLRAIGFEGVTPIPGGNESLGWRAWLRTVGYHQPILQG